MPLNELVGIAFFFVLHSRRIDKLEENTAPPEKEQQDQAVKELARSARCISQALPGASSLSLSVFISLIARNIAMSLSFFKQQLDSV